MNISIGRTAKREIQRRCHAGKGSINFREVFRESDFKSSLQYLHETSVMPNSTIGYHKHSGDEEIYFIVEGSGIMTVDGQRRKVSSGDAIITHSGSSHGLSNNSNRELKILVFDCNC
jgi:mannose-6-phosphate isomerase-like protein (cupin superfamily)